jgi:O-antigen/teichoic acid export membrane protein
MKADSMAGRGTWLRFTRPRTPGRRAAQSEAMLARCLHTPPLGTYPVRRNLRSLGLRDLLNLKAARNGVGSLVSHATRIVLQAVTSVILARVLLREDYGRYSLVMAIVAVAVTLAQFGLDSLLVRETAAANSIGDRSRMKTVWHWAVRTMATSVVVVLAGLCAAKFAFPSALHVNALTYFLAVWLVPLIVIMNVSEAALQGLGHTPKAMFAGYIVRPTLFLAVLACWIASGHAVRPSSAISAQLVSCFVSAAIVLSFWRSEWRSPAGRHLQTAVDSRRWLRSAATFLFIDGMWTVFVVTDVLILGLFSPPEVVGTYKVASSTASLIPVGMTALNIVISERIAYFSARKDKRHLQVTAAIGALVAFVGSLPLAIAFAFYGKFIIVHLFGAAYESAHHALAVLAVGQTLHVAAGYAAAVLRMTGSERTNMWTAALAGIVNVVLNLLLIPLAGGFGAALATAMAISLQGAAMWWVVRHRTGIDTSVLAVLWLGKRSSEDQGKGETV